MSLNVSIEYGHRNSPAVRMTAARLPILFRTVQIAV